MNNVGKYIQDKTEIHMIRSDSKPTVATVVPLKLRNHVFNIVGVSTRNLSINIRLSVINEIRRNI